MTENLTFDEAIERLEVILSKLEKNGPSMSTEEVEKDLDEADRLKNHCKKLLEKEREEIIRTAKDNNIPLEEIGFSEDDMDIDLAGDDDEEEDEESEEE
ncbi:MAG: exodeoxyribonuclease VII small subunit [Rickettsiales bacterium]|jgi:exonuclease VII small subunit|nr:exodeoxyribonuclease VII small subunit [Rickettsiales bacterium]